MGCCALACALLALASQMPLCAAQSVDGGRSELPGMKRDIFDQVGANKHRPPQRGKAPPACPKSDGMSPFTGIAFTSGEMFVRLNGTEGQCTRLITVGGINYSTMVNFSRTCGPAGEFKRRIAENISTIFFQGGVEWAKHDNDTIEVVTEEGTFEIEVSEEKYAIMLECWKRGCNCEQAKNPKMKMIFITMAVIAIGGLGYDSVKVAWVKIVGKKPPKHVECKNGHRMVKVKLTRTHYCDNCGRAGTMYQCKEGCNYDLRKECYEEKKAQVKAAYKKWLEKHPEEAEKEKKNKKDDDDDEKEEAKSEAESEAKSGQEDGKSEKSGDATDAGKDNDGEECEGEEADDGEEKKAEGETDGESKPAEE